MSEPVIAGAYRTPTAEEVETSRWKAEALARSLRSQGYAVEIVEDVRWRWKVIVTIEMRQQS